MASNLCFVSSLSITPRPTTPGLPKHSSLRAPAHITTPRHRRAYQHRPHADPRRLAPTASTASPQSKPIDSTLSLLRTTIQTTLSLSTLLAVQYIVARRLAALSVSFPAPLAAMLLIFSLISVLRFLNLSPPVEKSTALVFTPGVAFLTRWLAVFFVPNLVMLPLAPSLPAADLPKILTILVGGFTATLLSSAAICSLLRFLVRKISGKLPPQVPAQKVSSSPPSNPLIALFAIIAALSLSVATATTSVSNLPARIYALASTLLTFTIGQRLPAALRRILHPLITCTTATIGMMALLGATTGLGFQAALGAYYVRGAGALAGGGNMLAMLLGPAVITFAFTMDKQRRLAKARVVEVAGTSLFASVAALLGTATAGRLLNMSGVSRLMVIPRTVTAPLAVAIAEMVGANVGLAASVVALTGLLGANVAAGVLGLLGVKDPVVRGLSVGCAAHGLGTAAMSEEGGAFPFAALAMTLVGVFSTVLVAIGPFRALLLRVALGTLGASG
eukprot:GFKZ01007467.1.p1 GENE.GFKZ01007467.1~~GFKZ01007467.1.p1  ORF type:complete len:504 (+),score=71.75 GFKZ01007467.1:250-1761(+)